MTVSIIKKEVVLILLFITFINIKRISSKFSLNKYSNNQKFNLAELNGREIIHINNNNNNKDNNISNKVKDKEKEKDKNKIKKCLISQSQKNIEIEIKIKKSQRYLLEENNNKKEKKENTCNLKTCKFPNGICLDDKTCKCASSYENIKSKEFIKIHSSNNNNNNSNNTISLILDLLHNNKISLKFINNLKNFYGSNYCNYPRKFQIIAFLIESITIIGLGHFYLNRFLHGFIKMGLFFSLIFLIFLLKKLKPKNKTLFFDEKKSNMNSDLNKKKIFFEKICNFFCLINYVSIILLHIFDVYMLCNNYYNDGFGFKLISWDIINYNY